jgi:hypothetical protein
MRRHGQRKRLGRPACCSQGSGLRGPATGPRSYRLPHRSGYGAAVRTKWGLPIIIAIGFVFLLGSSLALVELGTSKTTCRSVRFTTVHRLGPVCTTTGGTSPVVYVILGVAIVIGVICLAAGITVLAVRISAPEPVGGQWQGGGPLGYVGPVVPESMVAMGGPVGTMPAGIGGPFGQGPGGQSATGDQPESTGVPEAAGGEAAASPPPGWYEVSPGGPKRWWDGTRWVLTRIPEAE